MPNNPQWTPVPWTAWDRGIGWEINGPGGETINQGSKATFSESDACLLAAAPDLYTVLELMLEPNYGPAIYRDFLRDKAHAALLKANPRRIREDCPACKMQVDGTDAKCATCGRGVKPQRGTK